MSQVAVIERSSTKMQTPAAVSPLVLRILFSGMMGVGGLFILATAVLPPRSVSIFASVGVLLILSGWILLRRLTAAGWIMAFMVLFAPGVNGAFAVLDCLVITFICLLVAEALGGAVARMSEPETRVRPGTTNVLATLSVVFGILGGIAAVPLGHIALHQIHRTGENGRSFAIAGLVIGYTWVGIGLAWLLYITVLVASIG